MAIDDNFTYRGYQARFNGNPVNNLGDVRLAANAQQISLIALGDLGIGFEATESVAPTVSMSTRDAISILTLADPTSAAMGYFVNSSGVIQFQQKGAGATGHIIATSPRGLVVVNDFGCSERDQGALVVNNTYHCLTDGTNEPLIFNAASSVTGSPAAAQAFRLAPLVWQGDILKGVTSVRISTGIKTDLPPYSTIFPADITVDSFDWTMEISGTQMQITDGCVIGQTYPLTSPVIAYFQRMPNGDIPTDYASAAHIKVSFTDGNFRFDNPRASGTGNATLSLTVHSIDRTNNRALKPTITLGSTIVLP